ncbi:MAG: restriction endonuclease subunit S [Chloroflexi bacterium]|nr:MAG: restriction endonuclease subunit S [Chloroflexota bacterium]
MTERVLKPGWTRVKFGDVVRQVKAKVDAKSSGLKRYIAGEHMVTDDLRIRRWGEINDNYLGPAFHMHFKPGQVLYGSRRTYLRKVAVPDFEGICANTTFVLEAKDPTVLLPELLPFIMQTEVFHEYSITNSKGSVNPYINFSDLAEYEFALPPLAEQRRIAEVLAASLTVTDSFREAFRSIKTCERTFLDESVIRWKNSACWVNLAEVLDGSPESGCSAPPRSNPTGHWVLALNALSHLGYTGGQLKPVDRTDKMVAALLHQGDLLISRSNTRERVGFVGIYNGESEGDVSFPDTMMRLNPREKVISNVFLEFVLQSTPLRRRIMSIAAGTSASMKKINRQNLLKIKVPVPPVAQQHRAVEMRHQLRHKIECMDNRFSQTMKLHGQLLAHLLTL